MAIRRVRVMRVNHLSIHDEAVVAVGAEGTIRLATQVAMLRWIWLISVCISCRRRLMLSRVG